MTDGRTSRRAYKIAVVDDDQAVRTALVRLLEGSSFVVQSFAGAREFIAALAHGVPACVLIDLQMPGMTGLELQQHLANGAIDLPTIVITAHDEPGGRDRCMAAGATAYLVKPIRKAALVAAIDCAIDKAD